MKAIKSFSFWADIVKAILIGTAIYAILIYLFFAACDITYRIVCSRGNCDTLEFKLTATAPR